MQRHEHLGQLLGMWIGLMALALLPPSASGQTGRIEGTVTDEANRAIPGVNIVLVGTRSGTTTDLDGRFELTGLADGIYTIRTSFVGFRTVVRDAEIVEGSTIRLVIVLFESVIEADEVIVTASRREQASLTAPVSVSVLSAEDMSVRNVVHLDDALRTVSGVHMQGNQINVRGSSGFAYNTGSRVLLLLDGMPLLTPDSDGVPFDALPFAQIQRVEVLKGPGSSLYGSGALGGVVNVITKDFPARPETSIRTFAGAYERVRYQLWRDAWPGAENVRYFGGAMASHARKTSDRFGFWVNLAWQNDQGYMNYNRTRTFHGYAKIGWKPNLKNHLDVLVGVMAREKDSFLFWNGARDALNPGSLDIGDTSGPPNPYDTPTGTNDNLNNQISLLPSYTRFISDRVFLAVRGRLFGTVIQPIDNISGKPRPVSNGTLGFRYGSEVQLNWDVRDGRYVTFGLTGDALATRSSFYLTNDGNEMGSQPETAVFAQWEEAVSDRFQVVSGLRFDGYRIDSERTETKLSPKISAAYRLTPSFTLRAAFGDGFRVPSFAERFTENRDFFPIVRNLALKPERSRSYELGFKGRIAHTSAGLFATDVAAFQNEYWNLVEPKLVPSLQAFQFVNLTRARIRGAEVTVDWTLPMRDMKLRVGYTFLDADDLTDNQPLAFRSAHLLVFSVDARVVGPIFMGADFRYVSEPERLDTDFSRFVADADLLVDTRILDLRAAVNVGRLRASLLLNNATEYYYLERPALLGAPRRLTIQLEYAF